MGASSSNRKLSFSNVNHQYGSHQYEMHPGAAPPPPYSSFHGSGKTYADYQIMTRSQAAILMHSISFADSSASSASETEEEELDQKRFGEIDIAEMERDCVNQLYCICADDVLLPSLRSSLILTIL